MTWTSPWDVHFQSTSCNSWTFWRQRQLPPGRWWGANMKSRCEELHRNCWNRRDEGMRSLRYCWTRSTPEDARERSVAPYSATTERPSGLLFQSVFSYLPVSNVGDPAVYQGRHRTYPVSLLFVFFSGKETCLHGPLGAMRCSTGDLITMGQRPLPFIDVGWKESYPYKRHFKLHEQQDTYSDFLNGWTHQQPQHMLVEQA